MVNFRTEHPFCVLSHKCCLKKNLPHDLRVLISKLVTIPS